MKVTELRDGNVYFFHGVFEDGESFVTKKHKRDGRVLVAVGAMQRDHHGKKDVFIAPDVMPIKAGKNYQLTALMRSVVSCVHVLRDGEDRPPVVE